jgi:hypothetical protein
LKTKRKMKMKKIMIMLAAVALVAGAQAASVNWQVSGTSVESGYAVYLLVGTVTADWSSADAIASAAVANGTIAKSGRNYLASGTATDASIKNTADFYYVVVNADKSQYAVSGAYAGASYVYDSSATPPESAPATSPVFNVNEATFKGFGGGEDPVVPPPTGVPEPTSGLLMLVGLGTLALRRKRA